MKARILLLTMLISLGSGAIILARSFAADPNEADTQEIFEAARVSLMWNNQLAGLLRSNKIELVKSMVSLRVAYEVAGIKIIQPKLDLDELRKAEEMYLDAYPTLKPLEDSTNISSMPSKYKEGIKAYFQDMKRSASGR